MKSTKTKNTLNVRLSIATMQSLEKIALSLKSSPENVAAKILRIEFKKRARKAVRTLFPKDLIAAIKKGWMTLSDDQIGLITGYQPGRVRACRNLLGLQKTTRKGFFLKSRSLIRAKLGSNEEMRYAVTDGGVTSMEYARKKGIHCGKERVRQIFEEAGLTRVVSIRTRLWYANRLLGPGKEDMAKQLTKIAFVRKKMEEHRYSRLWAVDLKVSEAKLNTFLRRYRSVGRGLKKKADR